MNQSTRLRRSACGRGPGKRAFSILEILAVVTLIGIIAMIAVPRLATSGDQTKANSCLATKGTIEVKAELWFRNKGVAPAANLSDIMAAPAYFPDGVVRCPVDGTAYQINTTTLRVNGHTHTDLLD